MAIIREGGRRYIPSGHWWIFADDVLVLQGDAHAVRELAQEARLDFAASKQELRRLSHLLRSPFFASLASFAAKLQ